MADSGQLGAERGRLGDISAKKMIGVPIHPSGSDVARERNCVLCMDPECMTARWADLRRAER